MMPYAFGDYILTCGEITYQSFGLDRKKQVFRLAFFLCSPNNFEPFPIKQSKNDYIIHIDPNDYSYQCMHYRSRNGVAKAIKTRWDRNKYRSTHHVRFQDKR